MTRIWLQHALQCLSDAEIAEFEGNEMEREIALEAKDYAVSQVLNWLPFDPVDPEEITSFLGYDGGWGTSVASEMQ